MTEIGYILKQDLVSKYSLQTINELTGGKKEIGSSPAVEGDDNIWLSNVPSVVEFVSGYCRHWYDMETEQRPYFLYEATEAYTEGQRVCSTVDVDGNRELYVCIQDAPIGTPITDTAFFENTDDRNPVLIELTVLLLIYNVNRRINPRQIPEQRQIDYDRALETLKDIQKARITLDIAERVDVQSDDPGHEVVYGNFNNESYDIY